MEFAGWEVEMWGPTSCCGRPQSWMCSPLGRLPIIPHFMFYILHFTIHILRNCRVSNLKFQDLYSTTYIFTLQLWRCSSKPAPEWSWRWSPGWEPSCSQEYLDNLGYFEWAPSSRQEYGIFWDILNGHGTVAKNTVVPKFGCIVQRTLPREPLRLDPHIQKYFWPIEHTISSCCRSFLANTRKALVMPNCW